MVPLQQPQHVPAPVATPMASTVDAPASRATRMARSETALQQQTIT
jgi:hypothetical protein